MLEKQSDFPPSQVHWSGGIQCLIVLPWESYLDPLIRGSLKNNNILHVQFLLFIYLFLSFWAVLRFELRISCLLGRCSTTSIRPQSSFHGNLFIKLLEIFFIISYLSSYYFSSLYFGFCRKVRNLSVSKIVSLSTNIFHWWQLLFLTLFFSVLLWNYDFKYIWWGLFIMTM
jgi:hypothetical protein